MTDKAWKALEREVARKLGGARNPLSGRAGGQSSGDVLHPVFYVEVKQRRRFSVLATMRDTEAKAKKEGKKPLLVIHQVGSKTRYYMVPEKIFLELLEGRT